MRDVAIVSFAQHSVPRSEQDEVEMSMLWHNRSTADPAHVWLRDVVREAAVQLDARGEGVV